jgi:hypothetical protein
MNILEKIITEHTPEFKSITNFGEHRRKLFVHPEIHLSDHVTIFCIMDVEKNDIGITSICKTTDDLGFSYTLDIFGFQSSSSLRIIKRFGNFKEGEVQHQSVIEKSTKDFTTQEFLIYASLKKDINKVQKWIDNALE